MTFDFFNTSNLAFGSKLTAVFNTLEGLSTEAEDNLNVIIKVKEIYDNYTNRNYIAPRPTRPDAACRSNEVFDIIDNADCIKDISYSGGKLKVAYNIFNRNTNRYTIASGETTLKEGYAFAKNSISNRNPLSEVTFVSKYDASKGHFLFRYSISSNGIINIIKDTGARIQFLTGDDTGYTSLTKGSYLSLPYTATEACCVAVISPYGNVDISKNGTPIYKAWSNNARRGVILYLKKGDVLSASSGHSAFLINYNR